MQYDCSAPIGVFDSGVGGVSVLKALAAAMPDEDFLYFGDSAFAPYGTKTKDEVLARARAVTDRLKARGVKALVIACNTATSASAAVLRHENPDLIIVGMEPAIKPAALCRDHPRVWIMATEMTLRLDKFTMLEETWSDKAEFIPLPCPELVRLVEKGLADSPETADYLRGVFSPHIAEKPDCVVLGCTHFPFARNTVRALLGEDVEIFDGIEGTVRQLCKRLEDAGLRRKGARTGQVDFESSSKDPEATARMRRLFEGGAGAQTRGRTGR